MKMFVNKNVSIIRRFSSLYEKTSQISSISSSSKISNSTIKKLIDSKQYEKVLDVFDKQSKMSSDFDINMALKSCIKLHNYERGRKIHQQLSSNSLNNPLIQSSLVHFYMQCKDIDNANQVFSKIVDKTNIMYRIMFRGFISNKMNEKVLDLLDEMIIQPDETNLTIIFTVCAQLNNDRARKTGKKILHQRFHQIQNKNITLTSAIHMLMKFGDIESAESIFQIMKKKDIVSYGAMMKGYINNNIPEKALDLFEQMSLNPNDIIYTIIFNACAQLNNERAMKIGKELLNKNLNQCKNNDIILSSVLNMLMKFGDVKNAEHLFESVTKKDIIAYSIMMNGYNKNAQPVKCFKIFEQMKKENIFVDETAFTILINSCSQFGIMSRCQSIADQIPSHFYDKPYIYNSLIDMWGKAGSIKKAEEIFKSVSTHDVIAYTSMINAYGLNGMGLESIQLYQEMPDHLRSEATHVCVLNACSHSGLLNQARLIFNHIINKTEKITSTMVDSLSRLSLFDEAQKIVDDYEKSNSPSLSMHMAMLAGARNCRNSILSEKLYSRMKSVFPDRREHLIAASILLCNTYSSLGEYEQANNIRSNSIKQFGNKVKAGLTWTEVKGEIVEFYAHDRSHPQSSEIYAEMDRLSDELIKHGHQYDASWITRPLREDESIESVLCGHSEKLAIVFNLIQRPVPTLIQVTKNLRVCGDCHSATKLIAKIRQCEIIVRDANRIHHFSSNGTCSCQDHF